MSWLNLLWLVPAIFVGTMAFLSLQWRLMSWLGRRHSHGLEVWSERLFPGIGGPKEPK